MENENCGNCRFYFPPKELEGSELIEGTGLCCRYPPCDCGDKNDVALLVEWNWPIVRETDWCGEWANPRPASPPTSHG